MPELPDMEAARIYAESTSLNQKIETIIVRNSRVIRGLSHKDLEKALVGNSFVSTYRYGKHLFLKLDNDQWMTMHFGMTGNLKYYKDEDDAPPYERVAIHFDNGHALAFDCLRMLGRINLTDDPKHFIQSKNLGPDALEIDQSSFIEKLKSKKGTNLKATLMEQELIAGIGNVYSDEILFQAGLNPKKTPAELDDATFSNLYNVTRNVLEIAVRSETNHEGIPETFLLVNRKKGKPCPKGNGKIKTMKVAGRTSYYCEACQA
ncbi:MAG: DNA-formamidopyrimidine glycosylase family protein [Balneolales bacterium]